MASTIEQVCNLALLRIGQRQTIDALSEDTEPANACRSLWDETRDAVLAAAPWNWATRRASLAEIAGGIRTGWTYTYALPADLVSVVRIVGWNRTLPADERPAFTIEHDPTHGRVLLTDEVAVEIVYIARVETVAQWPALFVQAVAWKLAAELALALTVKLREGLALEQRYEMALRQAIAADFRQSKEDPAPDSEFIRGRF